MTILQTAYDACKAVIGASGRAPLRSLIYELNHSPGSPPPGYVDRNAFGYFARQQHSQFLGYLLLDQERARLASAPMPALIPPLSDTERALLLSAHSQFVSLNRRALEPLLTRFPNAAQATDVYGNKLPLSEALNHADPPFPVDSFDAMAEAFHAHPALRLALTSPPELINSMSGERLFAGVQTFERDIRRDGPGKTPREISDFINNEPVTSPMRMQFRLLASLTSLRASLRVLNQMLFQAVQTDKPPVLDQSNIAGLRHLGTSYAGVGVRIVFQPDRATFGVWAGDVVLLKAIPKTVKLEGVLLVESISSSSGEAGFTNTVTGSLVSENLDQYSGFAERV